MKSGFSIIEILVAGAVMAIFLIPAFGLLSSSNSLSQASNYEIHAMQYSFELFNQLHAISSKLQAIQSITHRDIAALLTDPVFTRALEDKETSGPKIINLPETQIGFIVSPLHPDFIKRRFKVEKIMLPFKSDHPFYSSQFWRITVETAWQNSITKSSSSAQYDFILEVGI